MPCYDTRDDYSWEEGQRELQRVKDNLVPKLCHACSILEQNNLIPDELQAWWTNHKKKDEERRIVDAFRAEQAAKRQDRQAHLEGVRERLKQQLTDEEKEAIGLE